MQGLFVFLMLLGLAHATFFKKPDQKAMEGRPVFYAIVMGPYIERHQINLWLGSLRLIGKWDGSVVIVTDQPACLAKTLGTQLLGGERIKGDDNLDLYPGAGEQGRVHILKVDKSSDMMRGLNGTRKMASLQKASAWANVARANVGHPVSSIVYTDMDIVFGRDLTNFMAWVNYFAWSQNRTMALFIDRGLSRGEIHTGIIVSFPNYESQQCLESWSNQSWGAHFVEDEEREELRRNKTGNKTSLLQVAARGVDQQALGRSRVCERLGAGFSFFRSSMLLMPKLGETRTAEFVHFTNTKRWDEIPQADKSRYFYTTLGLPSDIDVFGKTKCEQPRITLPVEKDAEKPLEGELAHKDDMKEAQIDVMTIKKLDGAVGTRKVQRSDG